ncbi:MAG: hypothetical protein DRP97_03565 [Candidatus Latescibacterota bacterium]|nr:MAG: hypothetical protein DRP97_03565 [Candidatus Latescibacterota bacterium]
MKIRIATLIIILSASFEAYNFGLFGGLLLDRQGTVSLWGTLIGVAISFTTAIASSQRGAVNKHGKNKRENQMEAGLKILWGAALVIIAPTTYFLLGDKFYFVLRGIMSAVYALLPSAVMYAAGASNGAKGVLRLDTELTIPLQRLTDWLIDRFTQSKKEDVKPAKVVTQKSKVNIKEKPKKEKKKLTDEMLIKNIKKHPDWTQQQRADHFGFSRNTINQRMGELKDAL